MKMAVENYQQLIAGTGAVDFNLKKRRCKVCRKRLSMYNLNEYCFAHAFAGAKKDVLEEDEKIREKYTETKRQYRMKKKKKGKKNAKR